MSALDPGAPTVLHTGAVDASPPPGGGDRGADAGRRPRRCCSRCRAADLWFLLYLFVLSGLEQGHAQSELYERAAHRARRGHGADRRADRGGQPGRACSRSPAPASTTWSSSRAAARRSCRTGRATCSAACCRASRASA